ncbi:MAG: NADPH-dependent FMN reductase [Patescibacteria group bacterium]|jgi:NAD(P)H-dependent FMN reductase
MTEDVLYLPIILGTTREGRESEKVAKYMEKKVKEKTGIVTQIIDVKKLNFSGTEGRALGEKNSDFKKLVETADGLIIVSPEYNHSFPGSLKMALDMFLPEYKHKTVGLCGVSDGGFGGTRAIESLASVMKTVQLSMIKYDLNFSKVDKLFDSEGNILDTSYDERVESFLQELIWMTKTLKWGRENIIS